MILRMFPKAGRGLIALLILSLSCVFACCPGSGKGGRLKVAAVFSSAIEEPWTNVIHQALLEAEREMDVVYQPVENVAAGDFEKVLREYADRGYEIIFGDAYGNEEAARRVARDYPETAFCFGSGFNPAEPNFSVFDNWVHEPAYLCGMIAGRLTKTGLLGVVAAEPVPEVNRLINAFRAGARAVNPAVLVKIAFVGSWFDPAKAAGAARSQIEAGADLIYGERYGVFEACRRKRILAFGNLQDQNHLAPDTVVTGPIWDMWPTVKQVVTDVQDERYRALDYGQWSMMEKGGAFLASYHSLADSIPEEVRDLVDRTRRDILAGKFRVTIDETAPLSD